MRTEKPPKRFLLRFTPIRLQTVIKLNNDNLMKRVLVFIGFLILMALCANGLQAQDLRDSMGHRIGQVDSDGDVRDLNGNLIGQVKNNGDIRNRMGHLIGEVRKDGDILDEMGNRIGELRSDGDVLDRMGHRIGEVKSDGDVYDITGNIIGSAPGVDRIIAAVYFFFNYFEQE